ncbi:MAG: hypothetical protein EXR93_07055 [Gemmatimonadetes bacterium]|nr:hypothetical protein [Gemmatimonadota bacterium]
MRELVDSAGIRWSAEVISHGRTSGYLNPKVHRPVVQFTCLDEPRPRKYASLPIGRGSLEELGEEELGDLLNKSQVH